MPRIAAALAVVVGVSFSIGFNVSRYPAVWRMLGPTAIVPAADQGAPLSQSLASPVNGPSDSEAATAPTQSLANNRPLHEQRTSSGEKPEPIPVCEPASPSASPRGAKPFPQKRGKGSSMEKAEKGNHLECTGDVCKLVTDSPETDLSEKTPESIDVTPAKKTEPKKPEEAVPAPKYAAKPPSPGELSSSKVGKALVAIGAGSVSESPGGPDSPTTLKASDAACGVSHVRRLPSVDEEWTPPTPPLASQDGQIPLYATTQSR